MAGNWLDGLAVASAQRRRFERDRREIEAQHFAEVHGYIVTARHGEKPHICRRNWLRRPYASRPR
jgi:hypothetical protein